MVYKETLNTKICNSANIFLENVTKNKVTLRNYSSQVTFRIKTEAGRSVCMHGN